jgi:mannan endo-1,4-beta-mannosidase
MNFERVSVKAGFVGAALSLGSVTATHVAHAGFVGTSGGQLVLNGGPYVFSAGNSYTMLFSHEAADEQFAIARDLGLNAIRMWGFWNGEELRVRQLMEMDAALGMQGTELGRDSMLQASPGVFPEEGWEKLDYVLFQANLHGIKIIMPLLNEWREFGGIDQYLAWAGVAVPDDTDYTEEESDQLEEDTKAVRGEFWQNERCMAMYKDYVSHVLNRVNTYSGVAYKDDPAILMWELLNEPRYGTWQAGGDGTILADWLGEAAAFIKSIDPNHLVSTGEEGFLPAGSNTRGRTSYPWTGAPGEGIDFVKNANLDSIDVLSVHGWPFQWGIGAEYPDLATFIPEWIDEHLELAEQAGKPLYMGEFGLQILRREGSDLPERDALLQSAYDFAAQSSVAGMGFWHITALHDPLLAIYEGPIERATIREGVYRSALPPHDRDFKFDIFCPEDTSTCGIIESFSTAFVAKVQTPDLPGAVCALPLQACGDGRCAATCASDSGCSLLVNARAPRAVGRRLEVALGFLGLCFASRFRRGGRLSPRLAGRDPDRP